MNFFRPLSVGVLALVFALPGFAAIPDSLAGMVYTENNFTIFAPQPPSQIYANVLAADGTYSQLFLQNFGLGTPSFTLAEPEDGTYTYRKVDSVTAVLTFTSASGTVVAHTLTFRTDTEGGAVTLGVRGGSFRLAPVATALSSLVNCSNRSFVSAGKSAFTGFVIAGGATTTKRTVLVRAIGPGLSIFGITDFLRNPTLSVVQSSNLLIAANDDWSSESAQAISRTSTSVGAFPLPAGSKDAVTIMSLPPGAYIAQASSPDLTDSGQVLIEVYILP